MFRGGETLDCFARSLKKARMDINFKCPHCEQFVLLKMRMDAWDSQKHPFFKDNTVWNTHLMSHLGKTVFVDEQFVANVLETSKDYVSMMVQKSRPQAVAPVPIP